MADVGGSIIWNLDVNNAEFEAKLAAAAAQAEALGVRMGTAGTAVAGMGGKAKTAASDAETAGASMAGAGKKAEEGGKATRAAGKEAETASGSFSRTADSVSRSGAAAASSINPFNALGISMKQGLVAGALLAGAAAVDMGVKFQHSEGLIAASAGISIDAAKKIGDALLNTAGTSTFSANEMAQAYATVAGRLGEAQGAALSAAQATKVMSAASNIAEATGNDLASSTTALAAVMQGYHLSADQAGMASDVLSNLSLKAGIGIDQLGTIVDRMHAKLGALVPSLGDTGGLLLDLSDHGIQGARGVMAVQTAFNTLLGGGKEVDKTLRDLGVTIFDAHGQFVGMAAVIGQLQPAMAGMTDQQRFETEQTLFGKGAWETMNGVLKDGVPAFNNAAGAVTATGSAQEAAKKATDNFEGSLRTAKASLSDLAVKVGNDVLPSVNRLLDGLKGLLDYFNRHQAQAKLLGDALELLATITIGSLLVGALGKLGSTLQVTGGKMAEMGVAAEVTGGKVGGLRGLVSSGFVVGAVNTLALVAFGLAIDEVIKHWGTIQQFIDGNPITPKTNSSGFEKDMAVIANRWTEIWSKIGSDNEAGRILDQQSKQIHDDVTRNFGRLAVDVPNALAALPASIANPLEVANVQSALAAGLTVRQIEDKFRDLSPGIRKILDQLPPDMIIDFGKINLAGSVEAAQTVSGITNKFAQLPPNVQDAISKLPADMQVELGKAHATSNGEATTLIYDYLAQMGLLSPEVEVALANLPGTVDNPTSQAALRAAEQAKALHDFYMRYINEVPGDVYIGLLPTAGNVTAALQPAVTAAQIQGAALVSAVQNAVHTAQIQAAAGAAALQSAGNPQGHATGGYITRALGGFVNYLWPGGFPGAPSGTDTVPTWLTPGEYVIRKEAADRLGPNVLNSLNQGTVPSSGGNSVTNVFNVKELTNADADKAAAYTSAQIGRKLAVMP